MPNDHLGCLDDRDFESFTNDADGKVARRVKLDSSAPTLAEQQSQTTLLTEIESDLDSIQTKLDTANSNLVTIQSKQDAQTTLLTDIDTNTDGIEALLSGADSATHTRLTPTANTSTQLLAANSARKWAIFINNSGAPFFIKFGTTAVISQGIEIIQNGGSFFMDRTILFKGAVNGIVGSNSRTIEIIEGYT